MAFAPPSQRTGISTAEQLERRRDNGHRYDLIQGELYRMSPAGARHGEVAALLAMHLGAFVLPRGLGRVYGAETGFRLADDTVLGPDVAFVAANRLPPIEQRVGFLRLAPDLVAEIVSPSDRARYVSDKVLAYLDAGVRLVWLVEPRRRVVSVYGADRTARLLGEGDSLDGGEVLPGFRLSLADLFA